MRARSLIYYITVFCMAGFAVLSLILLILLIINQGREERSLFLFLVFPIGLILSVFFNILRKSRWPVPGIDYH